MNFPELNPKQNIAISFLAVGGSINEAADLAKVNEKTIDNWLKLPQFQECLAIARERCQIRLHEALLGDLLAKYQKTSDEFDDIAQQLKKLAIDAIKHQKPEEMKSADISRLLNNYESLAKSYFDFKNLSLGVNLLLENLEVKEND